MAIEARKHINAGSTKDSRAKLLDFYDAVALAEDHDDVDISDFQLLSPKFRNERAKKKRDLTTATAAFKPVGPKPKKTRPNRPIDSMEDDEDEDDNAIMEEPEDLFSSFSRVSGAGSSGGRSGGRRGFGAESLSSF